jgi:hypothetical protein
VNSYTWPDTKSDPSSAVTASHSLELRSSPRFTAETASTIVNELINSTKLDADVNGMSHS